jgi:quinol monooxygenase YgiN
MTLPNVVFIRHKMINFRKWKAVFEAHSAARVAQGCQGAHVFRRADNPKELVVMLIWSDLAKARQFLVSEDLRVMLAEMPVCDRAPDVFLLEEVEETFLSTLRNPMSPANGKRSGTVSNGVTASPRSGPYVPAAHPPMHPAVTDPGWIL